MTFQRLSEIEAKQARVLSHLQGQLERESRSAQKQLRSCCGRFCLWMAKEAGEVPRWVKNYTRLFKEFEQNLSELQTRSAPIPAQLIATYSSAQEGLREIARKLNTPQLCKPLPSQVIRKKPPQQWFTSEPTSVRSHQSAWFRHAALMMNAYQQTDNLQLREKISFLIFNYLAKSAPIAPREFDLDEELTKKLYGMFQLPYFEGSITYNRECPVFDSYFQRIIEEESAPASGGLFFITDTEDYSMLLPLGFSVVETPSDELQELHIKEWASAICEHVQRHIEEHPKDKDPCNSYIRPGLLFDWTHHLEQLILTKGNANKNRKFSEKLRQLEQILNRSIGCSIEILRKNHPNLCKTRAQFEKWTAWIRANTTCICRSNIKGVPVTKLLPVFCKRRFFKCKPSLKGLILHTPLERENHSGEILSKKFSHAKGEFDHFLSSTGIRLGSLRGRMRVCETTTLPALLGEAQHTIAQYGKIAEEAHPFVKKDDLINSSLFKKWSKFFTNPNEAERKLLHNKPYIDILGRPTINMLRGIFNEITEPQWIKLNSDPVLRSIIPTAKIALHLECAWQEIDQYNKFSNFMELIHYEMLGLLDLFRPFRAEDFSKIYSSTLTCVPHELRPLVQASLSKTAMNTFAGVYAVVKQMNSRAVVACDEDAHFELVHFLGLDRSLEKVLKDKKNKRIDLLLAEFNHNVSMFPDRALYQAGDVIGSIEAIFKEKPETEYLTVAVDTTIDYANSERARQLLKHFSSEILEGRLNFVFLRSGKKFDLIGMDDYYGSPFYMVNNRGVQWKKFQQLTSHASFTTDSLSIQGFCLLNKYAAKELGNYQRAIFKNTKVILSSIGKELEAALDPFSVRIAKVAENAEACFIDIKFHHPKHRGAMSNRVVELFYRTFVDKSIKVHSRAGYGYFYPNLTIFYSSFTSDRFVTIRINPGINAKENRIMLQFLEAIPQELSKVIPSAS